MAHSSSRSLRCGMTCLGGKRVLNLYRRHDPGLRMSMHPHVVMIATVLADRGSTPHMGIIALDEMFLLCSNNFTVEDAMAFARTASETHSCFKPERIEQERFAVARRVVGELPMSAVTRRGWI
jgi:hypothetical protein